ncbi:cupin domain-containing protein [bacterium]|nr:cupin domain-containing protein [bacterium]
MTPLHLANDEGKLLTLLGIPSNIRVHGRDTNGAVSVIEMRDQPGGGAPQHVHSREDETFQVLEGEYEFTCGDKTFIAKPGATVFAPRDIPHGYRYLGNSPGRILLIATPAGIEEWFEEVGALTAEQQDIPRVIELGKKYGLEFLPPPQS